MIKRARQRRGFSQRRLAERLAERSGNRAVTRDSVKRWETEKRIPRPEWRYWLSQVLDLPRDELTAAAQSSRRARRSAVPAPRESMDDAPTRQFRR